MNNLFHFLLVCTLLGCTVNTPTYLSQITRVGEKLIKIKQGESFLLQFDSSFGNGYEWTLASKLDDTIIVLDSLSVIRPENTGKQVGTETYEQFHFHSVNRGEIQLKFIQARPWQKDMPKDSSFYTVLVR